MNIQRRALCLPLLVLLLAPLAPADVMAQQAAFTHADTLRGSITPERAWWDAVFYDLHVRLDPSDSTLRGWNGITYRVTGPARAMQIDLQLPLEIDSVVQDGRRLTLRRDGNAFFVNARSRQPKGALTTSPSTTTASRAWPRGLPGTAGSSGRAIPPAGPGSPPPARASAPASGGRTRTRRPTSRTASGWR